MCWYVPYTHMHYEKKIETCVLENNFADLTVSEEKLLPMLKEILAKI